MLPLIAFTFWTTIYFRQHYVDPSNSLTLELALELDEKIKERVAARGSEISSDGKSVIPQDTFDPNYYKQPVITEPDGEPLFYRIDRQDYMTKEVRKQLKRNRLHVWEPKRKQLLDHDLEGESTYSTRRGVV